MNNKEKVMESIFFLSQAYFQVFQFCWGLLKLTSFKLLGFSQMKKKTYTK